MKRERNSTFEGMVGVQGAAALHDTSGRARIRRGHDQDPFVDVDDGLRREGRRVATRPCRSSK